MTVSEAIQVLLLALLPFWMLLAHELGHALVQLAVGGGPVLCVAGRPEWLARIGPLLIATPPRPDSWLDYGGVVLGTPTTVRRDVAVIVAGPVAGTAAPIAAFDWVLGGVVPLWLVIPVGAFGLFLCVHQWYALVSARLGTREQRGGRSEGTDARDAVAVARACALGGPGAIRDRARLVGETRRGVATPAADQPVYSDDARRAPAHLADGARRLWRRRRGEEAGRRRPWPAAAERL